MIKRAKELIGNGLLKIIIFTIIPLNIERFIIFYMKTDVKLYINVLFK